MFAYLDPGTGSMIVQLLLGGVAGALMSIMFVIVLVLGPDRAGSHSGGPDARIAAGKSTGEGA